MPFGKLQQQASPEILQRTCWMNSSEALSELELHPAAAAGAAALFSAFADGSGAPTGDAIGDGAIASSEDPASSICGARVGTAFVYLHHRRQTMM